MGIGCSLSRSHSHGEEENVVRWRGHILYGNDLDASNPSLCSKSSTQRRLSEEIKAMYTCNQTEVITIIHFNDVYNIESGDAGGGAARFATVVKDYADRNPLILFSGDCLNPSVLSTYTKGQHMIPILNALKVNTAVYGNHDFDFGVDDLEDVVKETKFPWLLSNVIDDFTGQMLADGLVTRLITWQTKKIGLIGLVEEEWLVTLATVDRDNVTYIDFVKQGQELATNLKEQGADFVIALTHMRLPNDIKLAQNAPAIDLILGGHDHDYCVEKVNDTDIVKSGSDFHSLSVVTLEFTSFGTMINIEELSVHPDTEEDDEMKEIVDSFCNVMTKEMEGKLGVIEVDLDARFTSVRTQETNVGNLVADIMLSVLEADVALLNSGTFRSDRIHPAGDFKKRDLMTLLPLIDPLMVLQVTGKQLYKALENGVSQYPKKEGRFPQVAGLCFGFDPDAQPGQRIDPFSVIVNGQCILPNETYRLCTKEYVTKGRDGYTIFNGCPVLVNAEEGPILSTVVQNHFHSAGIVKGLKPCRSGHRQSLVNLVRKPSLVKSSSLIQVEQEQAHIAPKLEGRILQLGRFQRKALSSRQEQFLTSPDEDVLATWMACHRPDHEGKEGSERSVSSSDPVTPVPPFDSILNTPIPKFFITNAINEDKLGEKEEEVKEKDSKIASPSASVISILDEDDMQTFWSAIGMDDVQIVSSLIKEQKANVEFVHQGTTAIHMAAKYNSLKTLQYLLQEAHMDPNARHQGVETTPLMVAASHGHTAAARLLLEAGAQIENTYVGDKVAIDLIDGGTAGEMRKLFQEFGQCEDRLKD